MATFAFLGIELCSNEPLGEFVVLRSCECETLVSPSNFYVKVRPGNPQAANVRG